MSSPPMSLPPEALRFVRSLALVLLIGSLGSAVGAQDTDVVRMDNGNVLVGEVKIMYRGLLQFKVDDISGRLRIEWKHIVRLTSDQQIDVELANGDYFLGSLIESEADGMLRVQTASGTHDIPMAEVVFIEPIRGTFWRRFSGDFSTGLSFTKSTEQTQFNFGGTLRYRRPISLTLFRPNVIVNLRSDEGDRTDASIPLTHVRFFGNRWLYRVDAAAFRNDELGIDLRTSLGAGIGRRLIQTVRNLLVLSLLVEGNREFINTGEEIDNLELALNTIFEGFRYDTPKVEAISNLTVYGSLTTSGRYRVEFDGRFSFELVKDFYWDIGQVYYRYDSDPASVTAEKDDYGFVTGLRYKFNQ